MGSACDTATVQVSGRAGGGNGIGDQIPGVGVDRGGQVATGGEPAAAVADVRVEPRRSHLNVECMVAAVAGGKDCGIRVGERARVYPRRNRVAAAELIGGRIRNRGVAVGAGIGEAEAIGADLGRRRKTHAADKGSSQLVWAAVIDGAAVSLSELIFADQAGGRWWPRGNKSAGKDDLGARDQACGHRIEIDGSDAIEGNRPGRAGSTVVQRTQRHRGRYCAIAAA